MCLDCIQVVGQDEVGTFSAIFKDLTKLASSPLQTVRGKQLTAGSSTCYAAKAG